MLKSSFMAVVVVAGVVSFTGASSSKGPIAADTIVCTSQENLEVANLPAVAKSEVVLRALGCRRADWTGVRKLPRSART